MKTKPKATGRPTVRTPQMATRICDAVGAGVPFGHACRLAGISKTSFYSWRETDPEFREQLDNAISVGVEKRLRMIQNAADGGDWRAAEAWLRLVLPLEFGRNRLELTGANGEPLAAGIQLYLPKKEIAPIVETVAPLTLPEGNRNGNH